VAGGGGADAGRGAGDEEDGLVGAHGRKVYPVGADNRGMKRTVIAALALLAAFPAAASADTVDGVVIARDADTLVLAGRDVATLRVGRPAAFKPGVKLRATAARLADGSYRASAIKRRGRAGSAKLRFTLLRRAGREYLVTAGGSTFTLKAGRGAGVSRAGAVVAARLKVAKGKVVVAKAKAVGSAATLTLTGRFADGVLRVERGLTVAVPAGVELALEEGDEVELLVAVGADGAFTLLAIDGAIEASGAVAAVSPTSITVGAVTCAVPEDLDVSDVLVGDAAYVFCSLAGGVLTADELELDDPGLEDEPIFEDEPLDESAE
jgi:hypothetical protein